jgi:putative transposon-encoded protein
MNLQQKFEAATANKIMSVNTLAVNVPYHIMYAEKITTRFGATVVLTLVTNVPDSAKVFLPKRYGSLFSSNEILSIQQGRVHLSLKYLGTCPRTHSFKLTIE